MAEGGIASGGVNSSVNKPFSWTLLFLRLNSAEMVSGTAALQCCGSGGTEWAKHSAGSLFTPVNNLDLCTRSDKWSPSAAVPSVMT